MAATPFTVSVAFGVIEVETGGALSQAALTGAANGLRYAVENGDISFDQLESTIEGLDYMGRVMNSFDKAAQNAAVMASMGFEPDDGYDEDAIQRGRITAVSWLMTPHNLGALTVKNGLRMAVVDEYFSDEAEGNKYLAEEFLKDIQERAQATALGDNQITETDITTALAEGLQNPISRRLIPARLEDGLRQVHPELFNQIDNAPGTDASNEVNTQTETPGATTGAAGLAALASNAWDSLTDDQLSNGYNAVSTAVENETLQLGFFDGFMFDIYSGISNFFNSISFMGGWAEDLSNTFKGLALSVAGDDYVSQFGDSFGMAQLEPSHTPGTPAPTGAGG
jgi:hypothetical protein